MYRVCLVIAAGSALPGLLPEVMPGNWALALLIGTLSFLLLLYLVFSFRTHSSQWLFYSWLTYLALATASFAWGSFYIAHALESQLDPALEGRDLWLAGSISSLVELRPDRMRFRMSPERASLGADLKEPLAEFVSEVQLTWYRPPEWVKKLDAGDYLVVKVRLKRPRGFANPGAFDYHLWQLRQGLGASGYVRKAEGNRTLPEKSTLTLRAQLRRWLVSMDLHNGDLVRALLLGDRTGISAERWQLLRQTGTSHLIAISGLHIGLVAGFGYLLGSGLGRLLALVLPLRAFIAGVLLSALAAVVYSALAGFSLPTQRALVMLLTLLLARLSGRRWRSSAVLSVALAAVLLFDPLAIYDLGFWLSFGAVATLVLVYSGPLAGVNAPRLLRLWRPQWVIFIGLSVPLFLSFGEVPLISPFANMLAIPVVSLLVVPLLFIAVGSALMSPALAATFFTAADTVLSLLFAVLTGLTDTWLAVNATASLSPWAVPLAALAAAGLLLPRPLLPQWLAPALLVLALALPPAPRPALEMTVLDVGQALAVVVRAGDKTLVYDTGLHFSERFDTGRDIIADYLARQGVKSIDKVIVSHAHADHAGGLAGLLNAMPAKKLLIGEPLKSHDNLPLKGKNCHEEPPWQWGEAHFVFVPAPTQASGNNASCVLLISFRDQTLVLSGDMEARRETALLNKIKAQNNPVRLLLAPHHGSRHSSSNTFANRVAAEHVIFSTGYRNRHGHPHAQTLKRYRQAGSQLYNTAEDGAVHFLWYGVEKHPNIRALRRDTWRFWLGEVDVAREL